MKKHAFLSRLSSLLLCFIFIITACGTPALAALPVVTKTPIVITTPNIITQNTATTTITSPTITPNKTKIPDLDPKLAPVQLKRLSNFGGQAPAKFQNVTYKIRDDSNVVQMDTANLTPLIRTAGQAAGKQGKVGLTAPDIIAQTGYIREADLQQAISNKLNSNATVQQGTIIVDRQNKLAFKVNGINDDFPGYATIGKVEPDEVLSEFRIPDQKVNLTRGNIIHINDDIKKCLSTGSAVPNNQANSTAAGTSGTGQSTVIDPDQQSAASSPGYSYSNEEVDKLKALHLNDPLLEFRFKNQQLTGYTPSGGTVNVKLSGYLGIDNMAVEAEYHAFDGYEFYLKTGEEMYLKAEITGNMNEQVCIPIIGLGVDAEVAEVYGGLYLIVGVDGKFTLTAEAREWLMIDKMGIGGGTKFYIPTSFRPIFRLGSRGIDADADFNGKINGYIKGGPMLGLKIFGFKAAGAGALFGTGVSCESTGGNLEADIYGIANIYAVLMNHTLNLLNWQPTLFHKSQKDTQGVKFSIKGAESASKCIWGKIENDLGANGGLKPYVGPVGLKITGADGKVRYNIDPKKGNKLAAKLVLKYNSKGKLVAATPPTGLYTDASGNFTLKNIEMYKDDKIAIKSFVVDQNGNQTDTITESDPVSPTCAFKKVVVIKADFFNDTVIGSVPSVFFKFPDTGEPREFKYDEKVSVYANKLLSDVPIDSQDQFIVQGTPQKNINILPTMSIRAKINYHNFITYSDAVKPTADFAGDRIVTPISQRSYYENGRQVDETIVREMFVVYNLGGKKCLTGKGTYHSTFLKGLPVTVGADGIALPNIIGVDTKETKISFNPDQSKPTDDGSMPGGGSTCINRVITRWSWAKPESSQTTANVSGRQLLTPVIRSNVPTVNTLKVDTNIVNQHLYMGEWQNTIELSYASNSAVPDGSYADTKKEAPRGSVSYVTFTYEGVSFKVSDPDDDYEQPKGRKAIYTTFNKENPDEYFDSYLAREFWMNVSPMPEQGFNAQVNKPGSNLAH